MSDESVKCSKCGVFACIKNKHLNAPKFCPMNTREDVLDEALKQYFDPDDQKMMSAAACTVINGIKNSWTRIEDVINFAREMGYKKLGVATCIALISESRILTEILEVKGFKVKSVCCKAGSNFEGDVGLHGIDFKQGFEPANTVNLNSDGQTDILLCNPIGQAFLLNSEKTDLNILLGLCTGHDALFIKYSEAPVTPLIVKDRQTLHNPAAVLYGSNHFFKRLMKPEME
ncbi:MAG: DUF1847 domain-containing protein [Methanobacterium sp.]